MQTSYRPAEAVDVRLTLSSLGRGGGDPTFRFDRRTTGAAVWRTSLTPNGPGTMLVQQAGAVVEVMAWGPGAEWLIAGVPELLGCRDSPESFVAHHPLLQRLFRSFPGLRMPRTRRVFEALAPAVLEQKVTGGEARRAWRWLVTKYGTPAPGPAPAGMKVCPSPEVWRRIPSWDWHRAGVDGKRARTVLAAAQVADSLERTLSRPSDEVAALLRVVPGIGVWTAAEVSQRAHGDADAVSVGDFHVPDIVGWALASRPMNDDEMLEGAGAVRAAPAPRGAAARIGRSGEAAVRSALLAA